MYYPTIFLIIFIISVPIIWYLTKLDKEHFSNNNIYTEKDKEKEKVAIASLIRKPIDLTIWLKRLREIGISHFFLRIEDTPELEDFLKTQSDITFEMKKSDKENNYETLQHRQIEFVNRMIDNAAKMNIEWIFHIDSDELLEGSLDFLENLDTKYKCLKLQNVEALYKDTEEHCFSSKKFIKCSEIGAECRSYVNGKAGGRTIMNVKLAGPHDFSYKGKIGGDETYNIPFEKLHILHYDSCTFGAWAEKFNHLSKNPKDIPFKYYNDSIKEVVKAHETYKKYTGDENKDSHIYTVV
jgi:hypothetical protein